jgi:phage terminase large subunit
MRYKGAHGGRGGAKSHFFAALVVIRCIQAETRAVCIREVQDTIKSSVKQLLTDKIEELGVSDAFDILDNEIRGKNGSLIVFKGMQSYNAANIKSLEGFDVAWVEEAQTFSQHSLDLLRPTLRKPGSELWFSWNPRYKTDAVDKFFRQSPPENSICVQINWNDNPWFKDTPLYDDMLADYAKDPDKAEHVWGGGYGSSQGAILARWVNEAERDGRINDDVSYDPRGAGIVVSGDLGFRDTCGWWYWQPVLGGANVLKYDADHGLDVDDWVPRIQQNLIDLGAKTTEAIGRIWLPHDAKVKTFQSKHSSQHKFMLAFGNSKVRIVPQSRKSDQIEAARSYIKKCAFNKSACEQGLDGLRAWEFDYNDDAGIFSREPKHNWASHPADGFAYGCQVLREPKAEDEKLPIEQQLLNNSIQSIKMVSITQQHLKRMKAKRENS